MKLSRREWLAGSGGFLAAACSLSPISPAPVSGGHVAALGGPAFGTFWRASLPLGTDEAVVRGLIEGIVESIDRSMSPFRAGTEISRFNALRSVEPFSVSPLFQAVVVESLRIASLSGGAFDPTVGPLVNRYGFGPVRGDTRASFEDITAGNGSIGKARPSVTLDLCGIAKGYALDWIATALQKLGIKDFVIEIGGEVSARGFHPQGRPWQIAIESPIPDDGSVQRIVRLDGKALATSGDAINRYTLAGKSYHHIIDPRRAAPVVNGIASVSVIARTAMQADALATALVVLGPQRGLEFASTHNVPTLMLLREGGGIRELAVARFGDYVLF